jgi:general secretion pathway protein D
VTGFRSLAVCALAIALSASLVSAQQAQRITPNFKDADITQIAEAVSAATGKNFIIDPRVRAQVTMLSSTAMSPEAFYEAFLSILQVYGFIAVPSGNVVKILPDTNARTLPAIDLPDRVSANSDEIVTQVIDVRNVNAPALVPILRPMIPQYGHLVAYPASNILIITDRASNVNRMMRIIRRIDQVGNQDVEIVPLQNAGAAEVVRVVNSLYQGAASAEGTAVKVVADDRSNSVLIGGDQAQRLRLRALIAHLDTPLEAGGDTRVRYLHYANAEKLAPKLKEQMTGIAQAAAGPSTQGAAASAAQSAEKSAMVWADPTNNALIITAPAKLMRAIMAIIDKLDIRRPQVLVEAIIADIDYNRDAEFGVNWAAYSNSSSNSSIPAGAFVSPVGGTSIVDLAGAAQNPASVTTSLLQGTTIGVGRIAVSGLNFAAIVRAIRTDTNNNIIATPSAMTMDNQEAELKVAQEVPFITGQYTANNTAVVGGAVNPFQTIQREEVGTILKITPTISAEGSQVMLKISIESSSLGQKPAGAVDLVTNKRTVTTTVLIEDGGIVVLGGLIEDDTSKGESRVPYLGNIPILGLLFKTRNQTSAKTNLMIFIRPKIMRDANQAAYETESKYNYMQEQQKPLFHTSPSEMPPLLPGVPPGKLPPLPPPPPPGTDAATGQPSTNAPGATRPANKPHEAQPGVLTIPPGTTTIPLPGTPVPDTLASPAGNAPPPPDSGTPPQGKP